MKPIINSATNKILDGIYKNLPQPLLLTGKTGVGLATIGKYIADKYSAQTNIVLPEKDEKVDLENGIISVDIMRRLYGDTRAKSSNKRIFIIDYAERMTIQAQNAFLKLLEEPNDNLHFILLTHSISKLLPTILSRVELINIQPISTSQSEKLLDSLSVSNKTKRTQILFIASGLPAEITRLVLDEEYFTKRSEIIRDARELIQGDTYSKLRIANQYRESRQNTLTLLLDAANMVERSLTTLPHLDKIRYINKVLNTYQQIEANGNIRTCLASMVV